MSALTPRPEILEIEPYVGGKSSVEGVERIVKLSANESAFGPSERALEAFRAYSQGLHRYPDGGARRLRSALGARYGLDPERIVCGNGSDELISLIARAYAGAGDEVLVSEHGFLIFSIVAQSVGATPVKAPERALTVDVEAMLSRVSARTRIVFIANPNNPTGSYLSCRELERLRKGLKEEILLAIDAAYCEFVTRSDYAPGYELVDAYGNVVVLRTFSKIHGLAALRLGWAYCPPDMADVLNRLRAPFNVSGPSQAAGVAALEDVNHTEAAVRHNARWREWLSAKLGDLGLKVHPSVCNFVLVGFPDDPRRNAAAADAFLLKRGIIVRPVAKYGLPDCLRITIGREDEVRAVAEALGEFMA